MYTHYELYLWIDFNCSGIVTSLVEFHKLPTKSTGGWTNIIPTASDTTGRPIKGQLVNTQNPRG